MSYRILLVEHDETLAHLLRYQLTSQGNTVQWCPNEDEALRIVIADTFHLILLDLANPGMMELSPLIRLKKMGVRAPIILLCDRKREDDIVQALLLGAEDVIRKPFGYDELIARIQAVLRRINENVMYLVSTKSEDDMFRFGFLEVFPKRLEGFFHDKRIEFRKEEFTLLFHFLQRPGMIFSPDQLSDVIYGSVLYRKRTVQLISALRKKIKPAEPYLKIVTIHSIGYKLIHDNMQKVKDEKQS